MAGRKGERKGRDVRACHRFLRRRGGRDLWSWCLPVLGLLGAYTVSPCALIPTLTIPFPRPLSHSNPQLTIQRITHIPPDILIVILIQAQRAARMLQEQVQQPGFYA